MRKDTMKGDGDALAQGLYISSTQKSCMTRAGAKSEMVHEEARTGPRTLTMRIFPTKEKVDTSDRRQSASMRVKGTIQ